MSWATCQVLHMLVITLQKPISIKGQQSQLTYDGYSIAFVAETVRTKSQRSETMTILAVSPSHIQEGKSEAD